MFALRIRNIFEAQCLVSFRLCGVDYYFRFWRYIPLNLLRVVGLRIMFWDFEFEILYSGYLCLVIRFSVVSIAIGLFGLFRNLGDCYFD